MPETFDTQQSKTEKGMFTGEAMAEFASSLSAGISGAISFSLVAASKRVPLAIPAAMLAGGLTKFGVKSGLESAFVESKDRTAGLHDVAWGAVDGVAAVAGLRADQAASKAFLRSAARKVLGTEVSTTLAETAGRQLIANSATKGIQHGLVRGIAGGAAGSLAWSIPHRVHEHRAELAGDTVNGLVATSRDVLFDTTVGATFGGAISGAGTALWRSPELIGQARAAMQKPADVMQIRTLHLNDLHSQNDQLALMKGVSDRLIADAKAKGMPSQFVSVGDLEGCNVQYISTKAGMPENSALMKMGVSKFIPGNHTYDLGSGFNISGYARTMRTLLHENPEVSLIASNLDLSAFPEYQSIARRFSIDTIPGPKGAERIATLGLVTRDGTALGDVAGIGYRDAMRSTVETMVELAENYGVKKFVILSHLGLPEDQALAQALVKDATLSGKNLKVAAIIGAHTHDATAAPIWVGRNGVSNGGLSTLRNMRAGYEIPVVQAGSNGRWLGQLDLAIRPDGAADRIRTFGRLHAITPDLPKDAALDAYVQSQSSELAALRQTDYRVRVSQNLSADNLRTGESELGNLVSDAVHAQVDADAVLTHSGWIRRGLDVNVDPRSGEILKPVTRETVADMFKSGGNAQLEKGELNLYKIRGDELRRILEFGVHNHDAPAQPTFGQVLRRLLPGESQIPQNDGHGYFLQVSGLKYEFNLAQNPGSRIGKILIRNGETSTYAPIDPSREYSIASREFIFDKWSRFGIFNGRTVEKTAIGKSPVEMVGELIANRSITTSTFKLEGRIVDLTPKPSEHQLKLAPSLLAAPLVQVQREEKK